MHTLALPTLGGIRPRRFGLVSWSPHVAFAFDLMADLRPRLFVELGTHSGESYFAFCQSAQENRTGSACYAVDTWKGDPQAGFYSEDVYAEVHRHNDEFYADFSYLVRATFDDALGRFADGSIDLLHFDGLHTYDAIRHDLDRWRPKLSPRGVALFHDIAARHDDFGVWRLWDEIRGDGQSFAFRHGWGLGIWKPAGGQPTGSPLLEAMFAAGEAEAENFRRHYILATDSLRLQKALADNARLAESLKAANLRTEDLREQLGDTLARREDELFDSGSEVRQFQAEQAERRQDEAAFQQEIAGLRTELFALNVRLAALDRSFDGAKADAARLREMRRSVSWRLTMPLRAVGRLLAGQKAAAPKNGAPLPDDGGWRLHLDMPEDWVLPARQTPVRGWCLPPEGANGALPPRLRFRCGGEDGPPVEAVCDVPRPDVLAIHGGSPDWERCGFNAVLTLPAGPSEVIAEAVDAQNRVWRLARFSARAPYPARLPCAEGGDPGRVYAAWIKRYDTLFSEDRRRLRAASRALTRRPLISVVMPVFNTPQRWLAAAIESVRRQAYPFWELCIADDASTAPHVRETLRRHVELDARIKVVHRAENGHISAASNSALAIATGEFVALLDHDDELAPQALYAVAALLDRQPGLQMVYSDEDKLDADGQRTDPYFKPDWDYDLFLGQNLFSHLGVYRRELLETIGGFREGFEGSQDYDLALRCLEHVRPPEIGHVPQVLYHWRQIPGSTSLTGDEKPYAREAALRAVGEHLARTGSRATVEANPFLPDFRRVRHPLPSPPPEVAIIVPTRDNVAVLRTCVESVLRHTDYPNYRLVIVDNDSREAATHAYLKELHSRLPPDRFRVLACPGEFNFSILNNFAVREAGAPLLCLLNNDTEALDAGWLGELVSHALRPGVGAAGARLVYPDGTLQHGGVIIGLGTDRTAGHAHLRLPGRAGGYFGRARLVQRFSAVTGACMVLRREVFEEAGGFNEADFPVNFNDVDLCLRLRERGYAVVWTPFAELRHHESHSRGVPAENTPAAERTRREVANFRQRHARWIAHDPAYNPNLTLDRPDFSFSTPPRVAE